MIDSQEYETFQEAWDLAGEELAAGAANVTLVVARYDEAGEAWVEDEGHSHNSIEIQLPGSPDPLAQEFPFELLEVEKEEEEEEEEEEGCI